ARPPEPVDSNLVYTYVEQMPTLDGQAGNKRIIRLIEWYMIVPPQAEGGRLFAKLTVTKTGEVQDVHIVKGLNAPADSAVLAAIRQLPRFVPGRQNRKVVNVSFTLPISIVKPKPSRKLRTPHQ
ncbi:MAG: hypothetical protein EOO60_10580, partial [Hymenobacter sp.]